MEQYIKPIETVYNGYRFRSRLEARWAVFFDAGHIRYEYEPEGFALQNGEKYLPDFYLPDFDTYVEVKPDRPTALDELTKAEHSIYWGSPIKKVLILSEIPHGYNGGIWHFPCFYWDGKADCVWTGWWFFYEDCPDITSPYQVVLNGKLSSAAYLAPFSIMDDGYWRYVFVQGEGVKRIKPRLLAASDAVLRKEIGKGVPFGNNVHNRLVFEALNAARQARFEHGETPIVNGGAE